jgi:spermidine/putrescine transport system substrate-binding protein
MTTPGRFTRRKFLWRASAAAIAAPTMAQILAACGSKSSGGSGSTVGPIRLSQQNPQPLPTFDDNPPIASGLSPEVGPLKMITFADYVPAKLLKDFESEFKVSVENVTITSPEEGLRKVASGAVPFDIYNGLIETLPPVIQSKLVRPLNHDYIPNLANIWPTLQNPWYDPGSVYTIASVVGAFGIGWRTDMINIDVPNLSNPWDALWDPAAKGIVGFYDQFREAIAFSLFHNGEKDVSTPSDEALSAAVDGLKSLVKDNGARITADAGYVGLGGGTFGITQSFQGDSQYAAYSLPKGGDPTVLRWTWPPADTNGRVGGTISTDFWMVGKAAKNPVLAHTFINWILGTDQATTWYKTQGLQLPQNELTPEKVLSLGLVPKYLKSQILTPAAFDLGVWVLPVSAHDQQRLVDAWSQVQQG